MTTTKPKLTRQARAILDRALRAIERMPKTFDMGDFMFHDEGVGGKAPYCGTVACLAGHITLAAGFPPEYELTRADAPAKYRPLFRGRSSRGCDSVAEDLLGIEWSHADKLFYAGNWPSEFYDRYCAAKTARLKARVATARVRHWLRTGE